MAYTSRCASDLQEKPRMSLTRKVYMARLVFRCLVLIGCIALYLSSAADFRVLHGDGFFRAPSLFHALWVLWLFDMIGQIFPMKGHISLGSQKHFLKRFQPIKEKINLPALKAYAVSTTKAAYKVMLIWIALLAVIGLLYYRGILHAEELFLISVLFYVCDLICVLIWCPFRLLMKTRCCTTCRIFNWDHFMMFSPLMFIPSFFARSLFLLSLVVLILWEFMAFLHPERFWEQTNEALRCTACTDKLCTQYCQKIRRKEQRTGKTE